MFICLCAGITDQKIKQMVHCGMGLREIMNCSKAGKSCGACVCHMRHVVEEATQAKDEEGRED